MFWFEQALDFHVILAGHEILLASFGSAGLSRSRTILPSLGSKPDFQRPPVENSEVAILGMALSKVVQDEITACLNHADQAGQVVQASARLMAVLEKHQLSRMVRLKPDEVGVHSQNRDGFGICPRDVHSLLASIASVGFDHTQASPICTEIGHGPAILQFNEGLVASSGGLLPPVNPTKLRFASLSCSHTNAALRCALHEVVSEEELISLNGRISMSKIQSIDKALFDACHEGLVWTAIHRDVMDFSPKIAQLIQSACNVSSHISKGEVNGRSLPE